MPERGQRKQVPDANTRFTESPFHSFVQSANVARNLGGPPPVQYEYREHISACRSGDGDPSAFFGAFTTCNSAQFSQIPAESGPPLSAPWYQRTRFDTNVLHNLRRGSTEISGTPAPIDGTPNPRNTVRLESGFWVNTGTIDDPGRHGPSVWNISPLPNNPNSVWMQEATFFSAYNARIAVEVDGVAFEVFTSQKTRVKLTSARTGFIALGVFDYARPPATEPTIKLYTVGLKHAAIQYYGTFAPQVWHEISQPLDFNTDMFRFMVWGETPADWSARTGVPLI